MLIAAAIVLSTSAAQSQMSKEFASASALYNIDPAVVCDSFTSIRNFFALVHAGQTKAAVEMKECVIVHNMVEIAPVDRVSYYRKGLWVLNGRPETVWVSEGQFDYPSAWTDKCNARGAPEGKPCFKPHRSK